MDSVNKNAKVNGRNISNVVVVVNGKIVAPTQVITSSSKKKNGGCSGCSRRKSVGRK